MIAAAIINWIDRAPTHAGGLFAIDRSYFLEIGAYDPGLLVWGGENFELSFKVKVIVFYILEKETNLTKLSFIIGLAVWW